MVGTAGHVFSVLTQVMGSENWNEELYIVHEPDSMKAMALLSEKLELTPDQKAVHKKGVDQGVIDNWDVAPGGIRQLPT